MRQKNSKTTTAIVNKIAGEYWKMDDISIFGRNKDQLLTKVVIQLKEVRDRLLWIASINPEFMMKSAEDRELLKILKNKTFNIADGVGLVWAKYSLRSNFQFSIFNFKFKKLSRLISGLRVGLEVLKGVYQDKVIAGSSLMADLCRVAAENNWRVFLLGGWGDRAERTARNFQFSISNLRCGWSPGEPGYSNEEVLEKIRQYRPKMLFVAYGMEKQEKWIEMNFEKLQRAGVRLVMGVGRSFDYYSRDLKRAPLGWRRMGLEWLYSLIQEPKRWRRQLALPRFVWKVVGR